MDDFSVMYVLHTEANLGEPVKDLSLWEGPAFLGFDATLKIATVAVVHNDTELAFFGLEDLDKCDYIWVAEGFQKSCLLECLFFLLLRHSTDVNHFHDAHVRVFDPPHKESLAEGAFAEELDFLICLKLGSFFDSSHLLLHHIVLICLSSNFLWH